MLRAPTILTNGAPGSGIVKRAAASASANDFTPNFPLHLMAKDLGYAIEEALNVGRKLTDREFRAHGIFKEGDCQGLRRSGFFRGGQVAAAS